VAKGGARRENVDPEKEAEKWKGGISKIRIR
jgi:hypothetical protein